MHFIRITDDATTADLEEAALNLMAREAREVDEFIRVELAADIEELLALRAARV
jgi:hypothetical protein